MINRALAQIDIADIEALKTNGVTEGRTIDYKLQLPGGNDEARREFLADVSSFANTDGGDIVFGADEDGGVIKNILGLAIDDFDALKLRLEDMVRTSIEPRLRVNFQKVDFGARSVVVLRIERSWSRPHRVTFKGWDKFFGRNSAGKYSLNVEDLRNVFEEITSVGERISNFHAERLFEIASGRGPFPLEDRPTVLFHLIPLTSISRPTLLDVKAMHQALEKHKLLGDIVRRRNYTFEGVLTHNQAFRDGKHITYGHFYRNGTVETVSTDSLTRRDDIDPGKYLTHWDFEKETLQQVRDSLRSMGDLGINPPIVLALSVFGVQGLSIHRNIMRGERGGNPIREEALTFPGLTIESFGDLASKFMQPLFDRLWNACGLASSENYDENGEWRSTRPT